MRFIPGLLTTLMALLLLSSVQVYAQTPKLKQQAKKTILIMGDSLSAAHNIPLASSWPQLLQKRLKTGFDQITANQYQLINASISGETTRGGRTRLPSLLKQYQPAICIIELGANDGLRGQSLKHMKNNLGDMIKLCQQYGKVLLLGILLPPNYGPAYTKAFETSLAALAKQYSTAFVPFFLQGVAGNKALMQNDGLHPNSKAQPLILNNIWPELSKLL